MRLSVSDVLVFQRCEHEWYCRCWKRRVPRRPDAALAAGTFWHALLADFARERDRDAAFSAAHDRMAEMRTHIEAFGDSSTVREFQVQCEGLLALFTKYEDQALSYDTIAIEKALTAPIPERFTQIHPHVLVGTPDRVVRAPDGKVWAIQYKTVSDRTPVSIFVAIAERSLHELVYAYLIMDSLGLQASQYGGTILNVTRKLSQRALRDRPESAFVQEFVPIRYVEVERALRDLAHIGDRMERIVRGDAEPIHNRMADTNRFGNVLNPYWDVRRGLAELDDDRWFMDSDDRYRPDVVQSPAALLHE